MLLFLRTGLSKEVRPFSEPDSFTLPKRRAAGGGRSYRKLSKAGPSGESLGGEVRGVGAPGRKGMAGGVLTVEAALTMGIFLLLCSLFFTLFRSQRVRLNLQHELDSVCESVARWSYLVSFAEEYTGTDVLSLANGSTLQGVLSGDLSRALEYLNGETDLLEDLKAFLFQQGSALIWQEILRQWLISRAEKEPWIGQTIEGGVQGLSLSGSLLQDRCLDLQLSYRVSSPIRIPFGIRFNVIQRSCRHLWIGTKRVADEEEEADEDIVYVTPTGTVYHETMGCRTLAITAIPVDAEHIGERRNNSGGRYYACRLCAGKAYDEAGVVFITDDGVRYHTTRSCSELKRTVNPIHRSEAEEKYRPCHYCAQGSGT